jgi:tetraacyldisaccharide 4'-kinase
VNPLSAIYGAVAGARNRLYDGSVLRTRRLRGPVVSAGNLSAGGAGKTPFVALMGAELQKRGVAYDVLSRGYGRKSTGVRLVDPAGTPAEFGDEPLLLARKLGVPVIVGESRFAAGLFAEKKFGPQLHLLDDGFQHRALARDFDIVLLSSADLRDRLLPSGRLREPLASLGRADALVFTNEPAPGDLASDGQLSWQLRRGIQIENAPLSPIAFCGIARPERFFRALRDHGVEPAAEIAFRDHHAYGVQDLDQLLAASDQHHAGGFITTEKDAINLGPYIDHLQPIVTATVTLAFSHPADAVDTMLRIVAERRRRP